MRFLIVNTDYPLYLEHLYASHPGLEARPYAEQMEVRFASCFGVADFYSRNLEAAGHEAQTVIANNVHAQRAWAIENGIEPAAPSPPSRLRKTMQSAVRRAPRPVVRAAQRLSTRLILPRPSFDTSILLEQIRRYRPDVLLNQSVDGIPSSFMREARPYVRLMVGQLASPIPNDRFDVYDLMLSSLPNFVSRFREMGLRAELHRFAFESRILSRLGDDPPTVNVSFIGTLSAAHETRTALLEYLAANLDLQIWGVAAEPIPRRSPLNTRYHGPLFGIDMYRLLHSSRATVNFHIDVSGPFANNMRLFEATGAGTLLVTDWKENLHEMFEPEREVVTFRSREECAEKIEHYLAHPAERNAVAAAGQARTLRDHTYAVRMPQLVETLRDYL